MAKERPLILASTSPFRKQLMEQLGLNFSPVAPQVDEDEVRHGLTSAIEDWPLDLAKAKASSLTKDYADHIIIGCDQTALFENQSLLKPKNKKEAALQLKRLAGQTHLLRTALAVWKDKEWYTKVVDAHMSMIPLSDDAIANYVERDNPVGCAGAYKIESMGPLLFQKIETTDFYSIIGLPLLALNEVLNTLGHPPLNKK